MEILTGRLLKESVLHARRPFLLASAVDETYYPADRDPSALKSLRYLSSSLIFPIL